jgi:aspartate dehydrogenase
MVTKRIGLIGFGYIGRHVYEQISNGHAPGLEVAFVWNRSAARLQGLPPELILKDLDRFQQYTPDLLVEMSHRSISQCHGERFLRAADYLMLSVTAMADPALNPSLIETAQHNQRCLFIPHGALVGVDNLQDGLENWSEVTITFRKHPDSLDFAESGIDPASITSETILFDGSVREVAKKFPRNVNTMATCALASLGFDQTRAILIADPASSSMSAEVRAIGKDGGSLETRKVEQSAGVSGTGMLQSQLGSIRKAALGGLPGLNFV